MKKFKLGSWKVEPNKSLLTSDNGKEVRIEPLNMALLYYFLSAPNEPVGREKLIEDVWGNKIVTDHAVYKTINQLRKYLASDGDEQEYIKTVPKKGYALVAPIEEIIEADPKDAINIKIEAESSSWFKKWFYRHPVMNTLGLLLILCIISWNFGFSTWWYRTTLPEFNDITVISVIPGIKTEIVPSEKDQFLLVTTKKENSDSNRALLIFHQENNRYYELLDDEFDYSMMSWSKTGNKVVVSRRSASTYLAEGCDLLVLSLNEEFNKVIKQERVAQCSPYGSSSYLNDESGALIYNFAKSEIHPASLIKLDLNTNETQILTNATGAAFGDWSIRISPDFQTIAFLRLYEEYNELYLLDLNSYEEKLLHTYDSFSDQISWNSDSSGILYHGLGSRLAIYSLEHGFYKNLIIRDDNISNNYHSRIKDKIYLVSNETNQDIKVATLNNQSLQSIKALTSSPSFEKFPSFANHSDNSVFVSNRTGSDQLFLHKDGAFVQLTSIEDQNDVILTPRWSPTDEQILFIQGGKGYIYDFNSNTTELLYEEEGKTVIGFMWDNTGEGVFFSKKVDKRNEIFKINVVTKDVKQITVNGGYGGTVGPNGTFLYYVKEDHFGLWRLNLKTQEEIKIGTKLNLDGIHSIQIYPTYLTFSITTDFSRWTSYRLDYDTLEEQILYDGKLADSRFNNTGDKVIWPEIRQISNKFLIYQVP